MSDITCWYDINVSTENSIRGDFVLPIPTAENTQSWGYKPEDIFDQDWLTYTRSIGLDWGFVQLFWKRKNFINKHPHLDLGKDGIVWHSALNWTLKDSKESEMAWFERIDTNKPIEVRMTSANTPYAMWHISELLEVNRHHLGSNMTLVRTNMPHDVYPGPIDRWCVSGRLKVPHSLTWEQVIEEFRNKKLLVEKNA